MHKVDGGNKVAPPGLQTFLRMFFTQKYHQRCVCDEDERGRDKKNRRRLKKQAVFFSRLLCCFFNRLLAVFLVAFSCFFCRLLIADVALRGRFWLLGASRQLRWRHFALALLFTEVALRRRSDLIKASGYLRWRHSASRLPLGEAALPRGLHLIEASGYLRWGDSASRLLLAATALRWRFCLTRHPGTYADATLRRASHLPILPVRRHLHLIDASEQLRWRHSASTLPSSRHVRACVQRDYGHAVFFVAFDCFVCRLLVFFVALLLFF